MEEPPEAMPSAVSRLGEATAFYKSMADELTSLSRRTAELSWATDFTPKSQRSQNLAKTVAPTGRLPAARAARTQSTQSRPQERVSGTAARPASSGTKRHTAARERASAPTSAVSVEVSTRKPVHLQEVKTQPTVVASARRGAQPRSQLKGHYNGGSAQVARARRLKLSEPRTPLRPPQLTTLDDQISVRSENQEAVAAKVVGSPVAHSASRDFEPSRLASPLADTLGYDLQLRPASPGVASLRSSVSVRTSRQFPQRSPTRQTDAMDGNMSMLQDLDASATSFLCPHPSSQTFPVVNDVVIPPCPEPAKARLASVTDLQLVLPETVTSQLQMISSRVDSKTQMSSDARPQMQVPSIQRPSPIVRPVIRGLIADVIDEMRGPDCQPAEVVGGVELKPFIDTARIRKPLAASIDEDISGRRIAHPPAPYEDPPPPYEHQQSQQQIADSLKEQHAQTQAQIQSQLQLISLSQAQVNSQREEVSNLARSVQQQVDAAQVRLTQTVEQQAGLLQNVLQRGLAEVQRDAAQAALSLQQSVSAAIVSASQAHPQPAPPAHPQVSQLDGQILPVMLDTLQQLRGNFQSQLEQVVRIQSEERAAHMAALRSLQQTPRTVQAVVPLAPPAPPAPVHHAVATTEVGAQVSIADASVADGEVQACLGRAEDHDARVARFTDYMLNGPTSHREPPLGGLARPLTPWPLPLDLLEIDAMLAEALRDPLKMPASSEMSDETSQEQTLVQTSESGTAPFSTSDSEDVSFGEVPIPVGVGRVSPGEVSLSEPSFGEVFSDALSIGELRRRPHHSLDTSSDSGRVFGHSAGEVSGISSEVPSSGQAPSSGVVSARFGRSREPGETSGDISSSPVCSQGEAVDATEGLLLGEVSSGELAPSFGEIMPSSVTSRSGAPSSHSPGSLASSGLVSSVPEPEPYLSPRGA